MMSPLAASIARRTAAPLPWFRSCSSTVKPFSEASFCRMSRLPSVDASSTAISSLRTGTASTRSTIS
jgi:hypothetical protein